MIPRIIAFYSNGRQAGKDTAANFVESWAKSHSLTTQRLAFADAGKLLAAKSLGVESDNPLTAIDMFKLDGGVGVEISEGLGHHVTGRDFIINLMEGVREMFGQEAWIEQVFPSPLLAGLKAPWEPSADITIVTDLRFMPEVMAVGKRGGMIVEIVNPNAEGGRSEGGVEPAYISHTLFNDSTLEQFETAVYAWMNGLHDGYQASKELG